MKHACAIKNVSPVLSRTTATRILARLVKRSDCEPEKCLYNTQSMLKPLLNNSMQQATQSKFNGQSNNSKNNTTAMYMAKK
jgi:hypothetical protein